jgi:hypothetical protein
MVNTRNMISSLLSLGYPIKDAEMATLLYNDNNACVKWCHNMITKGNQHIKNRKNSVCKWVTDGTLTVLHVSGKINIAAIFTKEICNSANFCCLRDSLMCGLSNYNKHFLSSHDVPSPVAAQTVHYIALPCPGLLEVLALRISFHIPEAISCLSASGHHLLSCITSSFPMQALMGNPMGGVVT